MCLCFMITRCELLVVEVCIHTSIHVVAVSTALCCLFVIVFVDIFLAVVVSSTSN